MSLMTQNDKKTPPKPKYQMRRMKGYNKWKLIMVEIST